ncbi:MAG: ABC-ATPase domain-containing protein [Nitrospinota bacterium]
MPIPSDLNNLLSSLDGKGYKAYKTLQGKSFSYPPFTLCFEHVQGDPFAAPSRVSLKTRLSDIGFSSEFFNTKTRKLAIEDHLLRIVYKKISSLKGQVKGSGRSGEIAIQAPSQKVIPRSGIKIDQGTLKIILFSGLPGNGRSVLAKECIRLFSEVLPSLWEESLTKDYIDFNLAENAIKILEDYFALRDALDQNGWVAFIADGSNLPRLSGISDLPLKNNSIPFVSPENLKAEVELPHKGKIKGMPVPQGITLIVGGGFHGKSTLLNAIQNAIYPHVSGDGRELIATNLTAVKIRAEDGRASQPINISGFMDNLPSIDSTENFSTQSASGSTSQAINIIEALEADSSLLLMDEDTCATNFMIRDSRMQALIANDREPITPLVDRVQELYKNFGTSIILVMGGSGDYFDSAHQVIAMDSFLPKEVTQKAKQIVKDNPTDRKIETRFPFPTVQPRLRNLSSLSFRRGNKDCVIQTRDLITLILGKNEIDVRHIEHLVEEGQLEICGWVINRVKENQETGGGTQAIREILNEIEEKGLDKITPFNNGRLALPRYQDVLAVLNRLR